MQDNPYDIAIIGAGIVGASVAFHATRGTAPARVLLLEAEAAAGYHTTGRSAALYAAGYGPAQVRVLTRASRAFFDAPPPGFAEHALGRPRGSLFVGPAASADAARQLQAELVRNGVDALLLPDGQAVQRVPVLRPEAAAAAVWVPDDFDIDVDGVLQGFLRAARAAAAAFVRDARVSSLERCGGLWRVTTSAGEFKARTLVNAAGAWADDVAVLAGVAPVGIEPRRRTAFLFRPPEGIDAAPWPAIVALDESWYIKPDAGLLLGSPANADPTHPHDVAPEELDVATGIWRIEQATTLRIRRPQRAWAGLRCFAADGEPVCGFAPDHPGFFWAAAVGGYGIQSAPAFGRLCAALLRGEEAPEDLQVLGLDAAALRAARFSRLDKAAAPRLEHRRSSRE
jgi:D-arginine dehydrogenase